jgi:chaperonin GroES
MNKKQQKEAVLKPLYDRVIVKRDEVEAETMHKGIILLSSSVEEEKKQFGTVHAVGKGRVSDLTNDIRPMEVKPGDRVVFGKYSGDPFQVGDEKYLMLREDQIYAVVTEQ